MQHCRLMAWAFSSHRMLSTSSIDGGVAVKRVTRGNFWAALEELRPLVRAAEFVAVDLEMTGVTSAPWREPFEFDSSDVRYLKLRDSASKFAVVQCGICPFLWDSSSASFLAHPYNFYIFPRFELPYHGPQSEFLCQTSSIGFLAKYQFDFNACIHEGISYLSRTQESEALRRFMSDKANKATNVFDDLGNVERSQISAVDILFTERMKNRFHEWLAQILKPPGDDYSSERGAPSGFQKQTKSVFFKMRPAILLTGFSSRQLNLIQLVVKEHFNELVYVCADDGEATFYRHVVYTDCEPDKCALLKEVSEDHMRTLEAKVSNAIGFRHVIDLLTAEEKLVVGHNCILDFAHLYNKFFGPLPSTIKEFASLVHENFPYIIDTKHLLNASHGLQFLMKKKSKSLSSSFAVLCTNICSSQSSTHPSNVKILPQITQEESCWNSGAKHEAGYDAFMTGCVFVQACSHMGINFELNQPYLDLRRNEKLQNYINHLYPSWNSGTLINLSTGTECPDITYKRRYPVAQFSHIALVWGFLPSINAKDMKDCISEVFGPDSVVSIFLLDATAALIHFSKEKFLNDFLLIKDSLERNNDSISVLHPLFKLLDGGKTHAADYDTYKEICRSSVSRLLFTDQAEAIGIRWRTKVSNSLETENASRVDDKEIISGSCARSHFLKNDAGSIEFNCEYILESLRTANFVQKGNVK